MPRKLAKQRNEPGLVAFVLSLLVLGAAPVAGWAQMTGDSVTGGLYFTGNPTNYFDTANGHVPGLSSGIQPLATVADPDGSYVEFMFVDVFSDIDVDVDDSTITVSQRLNGPTGVSPFPWVININDIDARVTGYSILSSNIPGLVINTTDSSVTFSFPGAELQGDITATVEIIMEPPQPVEPLQPVPTLSPLGIVLLGLLMLAGALFGVRRSLA